MIRVKKNLSMFCVYRNYYVLHLLYIFILSFEYHDNHDSMPTDSLKKIFSKIKKEKNKTKLENNPYIQAISLSGETIKSVS